MFSFFVRHMEILCNLDLKEKYEKSWNFQKHFVYITDSERFQAIFLKKESFDNELESSGRIFLIAFFSDFISKHSIFKLSKSLRM